MGAANQSSLSSRELLFIDTSGWCEPVLRNTSQHAAMDEFAHALLTSTRPLITTNYVLSEVVPLLTSRAKHMSRAQIMQFAKQVRETPTLQIVHIDEATDLEAWALLERTLDKGWSLIDATSFIIMRQMSVTEAFTSDHHFAQAGFIRLPM